MTGPFFVDANVILYSCDAGEPLKRPRAVAWLDCLWRDGSGRMSMQVLSEFYVNATRKLKPGMTQQEAWRRVERFLAWRPLAADESLLRRAREVESRHRLSWWDAMIVAAAQLQDCTVLLTEDLQDGGAYGTVTVRSPFTLDAQQPEGRYDVVPRIASPHRPRGRPRRAAVRA